MNEPHAGYSVISKMDIRTVETVKKWNEGCWDDIIVMVGEAYYAGRNDMKQEAKNACLDPFSGLQILEAIDTVKVRKLGSGELAPLSGQGPAIPEEISILEFGGPIGRVLEV